MAKKIKPSTTPKTTRKSTKKEVVINEPVYEMPASLPYSEEPIVRKRPTWVYVFFAILVFGLIGLLIVNRGMFIAAVVNGKPIFKWNLNSVLVSRYGQQTLDGMITEKIIAEEAQKSNISVTQEEINQRGEDILQSFGSTLSVDEFLQLQGLSRSEFDNQLKLQLTVQKILTKDLQISDQDIEMYIASNSAMLIATEPAKLREEARNAIIDTHVSEEFQTWIQELRDKASVQTFL